MPITLTNYWPGVQTDLEGAIDAVWPDVGASFESVIAKKVNWYNLFQTKQISNNYVVFQFVSIDVDEDYGTANRLFQATIRIYYIELDPAANLVVDLFTRIQEMQDYLLGTAFSSMLVLDVMQIMMDENEGAQSMAEANMPMTAVALELKALVGEQWA